MSNWYKIIKEANKEEFLIKQKPKHLTMDFWISVVKWAIGLSRKHAVWLSNMMKKDSSQFTMGEDDEIVKEFLSLFEKARKRPEFEKKDINQYKSYQELQEALAPYKEIKTNKEQDLANVSNGLMKVDSEGEYELYKVLTYDAAKVIGEGTSWCIIHKEHFYSYNNTGPMFYISKNESPYSLIHVASNQYKNIYNQTMDAGSTIPILNLMKRNLSTIGIGNNRLTDEFSSILNAEKELLTIKNEYSKMDLIEFKNSLKFNNIQSHVGKGERTASDKVIWDHYNVFLSLKSYLNKDIIDFLTQFLSDYTSKKANINSQKISPYTGYGLVEIRTLHNLYKELPREIKDQEIVHQSYSKAFNDIVVYVVKYLKDNYHAKVNSYESSKRYQDLIIDHYKLIPEEMKNNEIVSSVKSFIDITTKDIFAYLNQENSVHGVEIVSDFSPILNYNNMPKDLRNQQVLESAFDEWKKEIQTSPWKFQQGTIVFTTGDRDTREEFDVKVPNEFKKSLQPFVVDSFKNMFNSKSEIQYEPIKNTYPNNIAYLLETRKLKTSDIPDFVQVTNEFKTCLKFLIARVVNDENTYFNFSSEDIYEFIGGINTQAMTPDIFQLIKNLVIFAVSRNVEPSLFQEVPAHIINMPGMKEIIYSSFIDNMSYEDIEKITFLNSSNNNINEQIPKELTERSEFKSKLKELSLHMIKNNYNTNGTSIDSYLSLSSEEGSLKNILPDYISMSPEFEDAVDELWLTKLRNNYAYLLNLKFDLPEKIDILEKSISEIEKHINSESKPEAIKWYLDSLRDMKENIQKYKHYTSGLRRNKTKDFWEKEALPAIMDIVNKETSIFVIGEKEFVSNHILHALYKVSNRIPEIQSKLLSIYEKDKEKINIENFHLIKPFYRNLDGIDIFERILAFGKNIIEKRIEEHSIVVKDFFHQLIFARCKLAEMQHQMKERGNESHYSIIEKGNYFYKIFSDLEQSFHSTLALRNPEINDVKLKRLAYFFDFLTNEKEKIKEELLSKINLYNETIKQNVAAEVKSIINDIPQYSIDQIINDVYGDLYMRRPYELY